MEGLEEFLKHSSGDSSGSGSGSGYGYGDGSGHGSGSGDGSGRGSGIISYNGVKVSNIDGINTAIQHIRGDIAKGFIINTDLTTTETYLAKKGNYFAHGKSVKEAVEAVSSKALLNSPVEERIKEFLSEFSNTEKIPAKELYEWHYRLTGSSSLGRDVFVKENGIDIENDSFTILEFVDKTQSQYGGEVIGMIKDIIEK